MICSIVLRYEIDMTSNLHAPWCVLDSSCMRCRYNYSRWCTICRHFIVNIYHLNRLIIWKHLCFINRILICFAIHMNFLRKFVEAILIPLICYETNTDGLKTCLFELSSSHRCIYLFFQRVRTVSLIITNMNSTHTYTHTPTHLPTHIYIYSTCSK